MRSFHFSDKPGRDAFLRLVPPPRPPQPARIARGRPIAQRRFIIAGDGNTHESLAARFGPDYSAAIIAGDPEIDLALTGSPLRDTLSVYMTATGELAISAPRIIEVITSPDGVERERRDPVDLMGNIDLADPIRLSKVRFKRSEAIRRFVFTRSLVVSHVDGLTFEFLQAVAKELDAADELALVGAGPAGREPLVLHQNGVPWRGFLEGRIDGDRYCLMLRLSNMELKLPGVRSGT